MNINNSNSFIINPVEFKDIPTTEKLVINDTLDDESRRI